MGVMKQEEAATAIGVDGGTVVVRSDGDGNGVGGIVTVGASIRADGGPGVNGGAGGAITVASDPSDTEGAGLGSASASALLSAPLRNLFSFNMAFVAAYGLLRYENDPELAAELARAIGIK